VTQPPGAPEPPAEPPAVPPGYPPPPAPGPASPGLRAAGSEATGATREGDATQAPEPARAELAQSGTAPAGWSPGPPAVEPRRRLHPLTPLLRGAKLAAIAVAGLSWQGYQNLGTRGWVVAVGCVLVVVLIGSMISWLVTGYHVVGRELRVYEGLVWRRSRAIPLERVQAVELVQPVLARLVGLAELRLEVVGASKTEAPLAFLRLADATQLRERLLTLARGSAAPAAAAPGPVPGGFGTPGVPGGFGTPGVPGGFGTPGVPGVPGAPATVAPAVRPERVIHVVVNRDLIISQLLRPQWWALPLAIAAPIVFFVTGQDLTFIAAASTATAVIGVIQAPVRVLLADWRFTIGATEDGLRIRRGLLETRSQTVPPGRIQAVEFQWPLLWRHLGWIRANMRVAGVATEGGNQRGGTLLPVGTVPVAEQVVGEVVDGFRLTAVAVHPVPHRARWLAPLRRRVLGYQLAPTTFVTRDGLLTRRLVVVPYSRIQSVRIRQGPLQRSLRLASVWVDVAGGGIEAVAPHRDLAESVALASELAERSRAARHPHPPPADLPADLPVTPPDAPATPDPPR
jgi:putative membrane protein